MEAKTAKQSNKYRDKSTCNPLMNHQTETDLDSQGNEVVTPSRWKRFIRLCQYYCRIPWGCLCIQGLVITNSLTELAAVSMLITYLTVAREEKLINAAATVNFLVVFSGILSVPAAFLKDYLGVLSKKKKDYLGCYPMVLLTTQCYIMGMVLLGISALLRTSHSILTNPSYQFESLLLYMGLFLIALGKAGYNSSCVEDFFGEQLKKNVSDNDIDEKRIRARQMFWMRASQILGQILGTVLLTFVNNVKAHYFICASMMQFALVVFLIGFPIYTTTGIDVGILLQFKWFEKPATIADTPPPPPYDVDEQERKILQRNDELKKNMKIILLLVPISLTFLIYGIVKSVGSTFFLEQGNNMKDNQNSGNPIPPITILIIVSSFSRSLLMICIKRLLRNRLTGVRKIYAALIIIGVGLICSIICCAIAQAVEAKRLGIVVKHGLLDITGDNDGDPVIPMSVFCLLPQFIFLGVMNGLVGDGMESFFESELPMCLRRYAFQVTKAVTGIGTFLSVVLVSIAAEASTIGGESSWFASTVNRSHLDRFYRSLRMLCLFFCLVYAYVSTAYVRKRQQRNEEEAGLTTTAIDGGRLGPGHLLNRKNSYLSRKV